MTAAVAEIVEQVRRLDRNELEELLSWLADRELDEMDAWDTKLAEDSQPGGRLGAVLRRVRKDVAAGRTRPVLAKESFGLSGLRYDLDGWIGIE